MKPAHLATALLLLAIATPSFAQSKKEQKSEDEVTKAYRELNAAETTKKDRAVMERLMTDDYYYVHSNGNAATKAQDIASDMSPDNKWTNSRTDDFKVRVYGHVAVVTGIETLTGTSKGFIPGPRRFTEVWVRQDDKSWKTVGGESTLIPATKP